MKDKNISLYKSGKFGGYFGTRMSRIKKSILCKGMWYNGKQKERIH
jgi:hypothetical protein